MSTESKCFPCRAGNHQYCNRICWEPLGYCKCPHEVAS